MSGHVIDSPGIVRYGGVSYFGVAGLVALPARRQVEMSKAIKNVENSIGKI